MSEQNKAIVRRLVKEGFNERTLEVFDELVSPDFVNHNPGSGLPPTLKGWKQAATRFFGAFPDLHIGLEDEIAEGDRVVGRFTARGTNQGELMGIPATGKQVSISAIFIVRLADGKIVERWEEDDFLGMMVQLGVISPPGG